MYGIVLVTRAGIASAGICSARPGSRLCTYSARPRTTDNRAARHPGVAPRGAQAHAMAAPAAALRPPVRGLTVTAVIGLMAATGLRISECMALNVTDVDSAADVLAVTGKRGRPRLVPIHPSTTTALADYRQAATALVDKPDGTALFLTWTGTRAHAGNIEVAFRSLTVALGYTPQPGGQPPRLHDMRHSFSTNTLIRAHRDGADVDATVAVLATYLGHVSPASTYWYLTATPQLLELTATKVAAAQQDGRLL